jgi:predicted 3-demethylubiquinone-9 3-methyltransferase (glyoxalase superfamily)
MATIKTAQNIVPFLWFDNKAEEAMNLYTSIFPNSSIVSKKKWGQGTPFPPDSIMAGTIIIDGLTVNMFDAGPQFKFNESVSFFVNCKTQQEIDFYWTKLIEGGGAESQCGWLKDRFGFSWQIAPAMLMERLSEGNPTRIGQMTQALWKMKKLDIAELDRAYNAQHAKLFGVLP